MYITAVPNRSSPPAILLRESYRAEGQVRTRTLANLTHWRPERIEARRRALKGEFDGLGGARPSGKIVGVLFALNALAEQLGIVGALGRQPPEARLALFLVLARVAHGGSRLSAVRWAEQHAVEDALGVAGFDEDALYTALDWLAANQERIEQRLYHRHVERVGQPPVLVLYDVTSRYLEGEHNELAAYGYNRDGKRGKPQIVIGLLTADDGEPLAVRVFEGNTADPSAVAEQIRVLKEQFGVKEVVLVGDRGMLKAKGKEALSAEGWKYITALTDAQVRALLKQGVLQPDLFDAAIAEVEHEGKRLVLRCNAAVRQREARRREDKLARLRALLEARNRFVVDSARASPEAGLQQLTPWVKRHKLPCVHLRLEGRSIVCTVDEAARAEAALLDGCYTLETTVSAAHLDAPPVDARYRALQNVERDFRTLKTQGLEIRPLFLRKAERTRAHVFVAMLALKLTRAFEQKLRAVFGTTEETPKTLTLDEALLALSRLTYLQYDIPRQTVYRLPRPDALQSAVFEALGMRLPAHAAAVV